MKKSTQNNTNISELLSPHLFWDVDRAKIDVERNKKWLINRILEYGLINDWIYILKYYGIDEITEIAIKLRDLDKKTISLISTLSDVPKEIFLCYNTEQSNQKHWNF